MSPEVFPRIRIIERNLLKYIVMADRKLLNIELGRMTAEEYRQAPESGIVVGYPGARYYGGCEIVDQIEQLAIDRLCQLFGAEYVPYLLPPKSTSPR